MDLYIFIHQYCPIWEWTWSEKSYSLPPPLHVHVHIHAHTLTTHRHIHTHTQKSSLLPKSSHLLLKNARKYIPFSFLFNVFSHKWLEEYILKLRTYTISTVVPMTCVPNNSVNMTNIKIKLMTIQHIIRSYQTTWICTWRTFKMRQMFHQSILPLKLGHVVLCLCWTIYQSEWYLYGTNPYTYIYMF